MTVDDLNVWSGRASQVDFAELAVSGLASMYPAFDWSVVLLAIMDISARAISLPDRPQRAIRVTSVRMRREDRSPSRLILSQTSAGKNYQATSSRAPHPSVLIGCSKIKQFGWLRW